MTDDAAQVRPFAAFLQEHRGGLTHHELSEGLAELVREVLEHRKPGSLTLKMTIKPTGDGIAVSVADAISIKTPVGERETSLFFADQHGNLGRKDPRQLTIPLREATPRPAAQEATP